MKSYLANRGWLFPLEAGPWKGAVLRLGWCRYAGDEYVSLDDFIVAPGGRYVKRPWLDKEGDRKMVAEKPRTRVEGWVYAWVPDSPGGGSRPAAAGVR